MRLLLFYMFFFVVLNTKAQTGIYHPFPQGYLINWEWEKTINQGNGPISNYPTYSWQSDTTINGIEYWNVTGGTVWQDQSMQAAYYTGGGTVDQIITLDINLAVGDTFVTHMLTGIVPFYPIWGPDTLFSVTSIDSVEIGGAYRSEIRIAPVPDNSFGNVGLSYVPGVGFTSYGGFEFGGWVMCHSVNDNLLIGGGPFGPPCQLSIEDNVNEIIQISPNPALHAVNFNQFVDEVSFYAMDGKHKQTFRFTKSANISALPTGAYLAKITIENKTVVRKVIKR